MSFIKKILHGLRLLKDAFGGYKWQIITLTMIGFLSGLLEGVGANALIPLFSFITGGGKADDFISRSIEKFFDFIGLDFSLTYLLVFIAVLFIAKAIVLFIGSSAVYHPLFNLTAIFSQSVDFTNSVSKGQTLTLFGNQFLVDSSTDNSKLVLISGGTKKITLQNDWSVMVGDNGDIVDGTVVTFVGSVNNLVSLSISFGGSDSDHDAIPLGGYYLDPLFNQFQLLFKNI